MNKEKFGFSPLQEKAIGAKDNNVLVSAGAGSGKTAVLTERIYRLAKEGGTLDNFLVLTFTNNAAAEMKNRVRDKLLKDKETIYLASEVDNSHIETFDAFSLYLVKKYFYELGVSKDINIIDNSIFSIKRKEIIKNLFEELYIKEDKDFLALVNEYSVKDDSELEKFVLDILTKGNYKADNYGYYNHLLEIVNDPNYVSNAINDIVRDTKEQLSFIYDKASEVDDAEDSEIMCEFISKALAINDYDELYDYLSQTLANKKGVKDEYAKAQKEMIKEYYDKHIRFYKDSRLFGHKEDIENQYKSIIPFIKTIISLVIEVEHRLDEFKKRYNAYSFGDISRFVIKLIKNDDIRKEISEQFDYIMIDEYQDTNDVQEVVINQIQRNNVYMVGDIKQSIYRFRGADCSIFEKKYEDYKKNIGGEEIDLNTSYRSKKEVVDFVNDIFSQLMLKKYNPIDYSNGHHFEYGRKEYENGEPKEFNYSPELYEFSYQNSSEVAKKDASIVTGDILRKINDGFKVYDFDLKRYRPCEFKDFAIIIDRNYSFDEYRRKCASLNIPLKVVDKEELFKSDIILVVKNLVKMLYYSLNNDFEEAYHHAYFSIARSFLYQYSDKKLYEIAKNRSYLNEEFAQKIELIKERLRFAPIKVILETLYEEFDIYFKISRITQYYANAHKIESLLDVCDSFDTLEYSLTDFINYLDDLNLNNEDVDYSENDNNENSVTLINIHKSKGLEYNIIYFPGLSKQFNRADIKSSFLLSDHYGVSLTATLDQNHHSLTSKLIKLELAEADFEEKIRLLYVAFTRAKQKIIIVSAQKEGAKEHLKSKSDIITMNELLSLTDIFEKYKSDYDLEDRLLVRVKERKELNKIVIKEIKVDSEPIEYNRASKNSDNDIDTSLLDFGSELHKYLEEVDLDNRNLDYIQNKQMRRYVNNVISSFLFKGVTNKMCHREFHFYDEKNNVEGFIDALIIKDDSVIIVDYKIKNISDIEYDKQLRTYKKYISQITNKPISMYLIGALTGEVREVLDE